MALVEIDGQMFRTDQVAAVIDGGDATRIYLLVGGVTLGPIRIDLPAAEVSRRIRMNGLITRALDGAAKAGGGK